MAEYEEEETTEEDPYERAHDLDDSDQSTDGGGDGVDGEIVADPPAGVDPDFTEDEGEPETEPEKPERTSPF